VSGVLAAARVEAASLSQLSRVRGALLLCLLGPAVFAAAIDGSQSLPVDTLFGRELHDSGFAVPLVVLGFVGTWGLPALTAVVAGDIFATEDAAGTWPALLTRGTTRGQLFAAKVLAASAYSVVVVVVLAGSSLGAGLLVVGDQPLQGVDGALLARGLAVRGVLLSWLVVLPPTLAFTALGVLASVVSRRPTVGVLTPLLLGLVLQLLGVLPGIDRLRRALPTTPFAAWHGLLASPRYDGPALWGTAVSAGWVLVLLCVAWAVVRRRERAA